MNVAATSNPCAKEKEGGGGLAACGVMVMILEEEAYSAPAMVDEELASGLAMVVSPLMARFHGGVVSRWRHSMVVTSVAFRRERREKKLADDEDGTAEAERRLTALAARVSVEKVEKIMLMC
ncbi:hypothetical protein LR48_Vigan09g135600 [Vigna angularis]|uniref:Uncharacterized protein n=1 Tax=Phaseolus angularis TaxID=3914 RepID=A0A0L9VCQ1_PHAAN|nr:hypothetical protein LR48_Vigan09g135600 [Vigna angularis]